MKVLYLFNKVLGDTTQEAREGKGHDSWLFGMLRLPQHGIETDFLEIERYIPKNIAHFLRKNILTMHYAHLPLFPLFFKYDIVFTSTAFGCLTLKALLRIKKFKWIVLDFNILGTLEQRKTIKQKIFHWAIWHGADGIVAISQSEADALKNTFPHLKDRIIFLHEATDINFFTQDANIKEQKNILSVGNYGRDFNTVIEATEGLGCEVILATKLKVKDAPHVQIVHLNHKDMLKTYSEALIVIISLKVNDAYFDSVGTLALGEALSMGKVVIVTHTKSMESYIQHGINGILVPQGNAAEMRKEIIHLMNNEELRKDIAKNARDFACKYLDGEVFARNLAEYMKSVV